MGARAGACHDVPMHNEKLRIVREGLVNRQAELRERVRRVQDDLRRMVTPLPGDAPDAAIVMENDEILHAVDASAKSELRQIGYALERLDSGTYGLCERCGKPIDAERLRIVPYAVFCPGCAPAD
jgi:DnaK suppressor protein